MVMTRNEFIEWFPASVGVRQGRLLSPTFCNIFLENVMSESLIECQSPVKIGGRIISNLNFADDIDVINGSAEDQDNQTAKLDDTSCR